METTVYIVVIVAVAIVIAIVGVAWLLRDRLLIQAPGGRGKSTLLRDTGRGHCRT